MFAVWCTIAECAVLRWARDVIAITHPAPGAIDVLLRCDCGALVRLETGRARGGETVVHGVSADAAGGSAAPVEGRAR